MRRLPVQKGVKLVEPLDMLFERLLTPTHRAGPSPLVCTSYQASAPLLNFVLESDSFGKLTSFPITDSSISYHFVNDSIESPMSLCCSRNALCTLMASALIEASAD